MSEDQFIVLTEEIRSRSGNLKEALLVAEVGLSQFPMSWKLLNNRGLILDDMGLREHSFQSYLRAFEINALDESVVYNLGNYYYGEQDFDTAIRYYEEALRLNPEKKSALNKISVAYRNLKRYDKFLEFALLVYNLEHNEMYATNLVLAYSECGQLDKAYDLLQAFFPPESEKRRTLKAYTDWENGKYEEVIAALGLGESVVNLDVAHALLESYLALGLLDEAISSFEIMKSINSYSAAEYQNFGFLLHKYNHFELSNTYLRKCISLNPKMVEPRITLTANLGTQKDFAEALATCEEALKLFPKESRLIRNKYLLLMDQGHMKEATSFLLDKMFEGAGIEDFVPPQLREILELSFEQEGRVNSPFSIFDEVRLKVKFPTKP
jgi:tetratricopeptide (TPR) repeat protein